MWNLDTRVNRTREKGSFRAGAEPVSSVHFGGEDIGYMGLGRLSALRLETRG